MKQKQNNTDANKKMNELELSIDKVSEPDGKKKKQMSKKETTRMKRRTKRNLSYVSWLDNERRLRNLTTP